MADQNSVVQAFREASDAQAERVVKPAKRAERAVGAANPRAEALALV